MSWIQLRIQWSLLLVLCSPAVFAQDAAQGAATDAERARIRNERVAVEARFAADETACKKKFIVTDCVKEARSRRREALGDLRRQDISLNDAERKRKAAEQVNRMEQKSQLQRQQDAVDRRAEAHDSLVSRLRRSEKKAEDRAVYQGTLPDKRAASDSRDASAASKAASRAGKASTAADAKRKYDEKIRQAQERKDEAAKKAASKTKAPANPLPEVPNSGPVR